jgi:hypothetical protein
MAKFRVQYDDGPTLEIEAADAERAWDEYKARTKTEKRPAGLRRRIVAEARGEIEPPAIELVAGGE